MKQQKKKKETQNEEQGKEDETKMKRKRRINSKSFYKIDNAISKRNTPKVSVDRLNKPAPLDIKEKGRGALGRGTSPPLCG